MQKITTTEELKDAIRLLEEKRIAQKELLKEEFFFTRQKLKPTNLVKNTFNQVFTGPNMFRTLLITSAGLTAGYFSKKYFRGLTGRILRKILGKIV
jgi:hypothetical protein